MFGTLIGLAIVAGLMVIAIRITNRQSIADIRVNGAENPERYDFARQD